MPGISVSKIPIPFNKGGGINWSSYWAQQWYGIEINEANTSPDVTRIASDMTEHDGTYLHAVLPVHAKIRGCLLLDNGTVNYYLDAADWSKKADGTASNLTGADGQVMIEWPDFYYKVETDYPSAGKHQIKISCSALAGFTKYPKHYVSAYQAAMDRINSKLSSVKNTTTQYRGGNNTSAWDAAANSLLGKPATNISRTNFRTYARNRGSGFNAYGYNDHKWLFWLFAIQYATLNSQKAVNATKTAQGYFQGGLGNGVSNANSTEWNNFCGNNPFIPCGASDSLGNGSGEVNYTVTDFGGAGINRTFTVPRFLGHENPFGHIWMILDGININIQAADSGGESQVFVADNPSSWNDANYTGYTNRGLMHRANGYMNKALLGAGAEFVPSEAGISGSGTGTYYCDYFYTSIPASGSNLRMLVVGGDAKSGARGGFACSASNYAPSDAIVYVGSRLRFEGA